MKKRMKSILSVLFLAIMLVNIIPVYAGATEATPAPTEAATDAAATDAAAGGAVTYSGSYNAYMGFQTDTNLWIFRNAYDDATYGFGTEEFKGLSSVKDGVSTKYDGTFTDAVIDGDGTYTVTLENPDLQSETHISLLYVSTDLPLSDTIQITNVTCKFDGNTKQTFDVATQDKDSKKYVKFLLLNNWNADFKDLFFYPMPFKKCEITFTVSGMGYESPTANAAAATPTVAPAASTDTASTDTAATDTAETSAPAADETSGGLSTPVIIGIVAAAVVVIAVVVVVLTRKRKN